MQVSKQQRKEQIPESPRDNRYPVFVGGPGGLSEIDVTRCGGTFKRSAYIWRVLLRLHYLLSWFRNHPDSRLELWQSNGTSQTILDHLLRAHQDPSKQSWDPECSWYVGSTSSLMASPWSLTPWRHCPKPQLFLSFHSTELLNIWLRSHLSLHQ